MAGTQAAGENARVLRDGLCILRFGTKWYIRSGLGAVKEDIINSMRKQSYCSSLLEVCEFRFRIPSADDDLFFFGYLYAASPSRYLREYDH